MVGEFSHLCLNSLAALVCCLLAPSACPTLETSPAVAGPVVFRCDPHPWWSLRGCVGAL